MWRKTNSTAGRMVFGVDKCLSIAYNSWVTTAEVAEVKSNPSVRQLPQGERDFRRRNCSVPEGYFLGPRRRCAELSPLCGVVLPGRTLRFSLCRRAQGFFILKEEWIMKKTPFITLEKAREIAQEIPTPFHVYDEAGIRANARALKQAFSWNQGFKEYFAVKANPNPYILHPKSF